MCLIMEVYMKTFNDKILEKYKIDLQEDSIASSFKTHNLEEFEHALNLFTKYVITCLVNFLNSFDIPLDSTITADISNTFLKQHASSILDDYNNTMKKIQNAFDKIILESNQPHSIEQQDKINEWKVVFTRNVTLYIEKIRHKTDEFLKTTSKDQLGEKLYHKLDLIKNLTVDDIFTLLKG